MRSNDLKSQSGRNVLITGGTGFVGKAVLARLVEVPSYDKIYLLVRSKRGADPQKRVDDIVAKMFPNGRVAELAARIVAVPGDLTLPGLGMSDSVRKSLRAGVHQILHVGASTDFGAPLAESRLNNVEGTRQALDLAIELKEYGVLRRFDYVSTAYVSGRKAGVISEDNLARKQEFSNNYEQSKYEAEVLVQAHMHKVPTAIYRPSIVVGDSNSGYTPHFKVLYWPLMLLSKNLLPFFACNQNAHLDVVPVDYVADGIVALMQREQSIGETFHLTAGLGNEIRIRQILRDAYRFAGITQRPIIPIWVFKAIRSSPVRKFFHEGFWDAVQMAQPYDFYLRGTGVRFDARKTAEVLSSLDVSPPRWDEYKREVLNYCHASRWGRKVPMPEYVYYLPVSSRKDLWREIADSGQQDASSKSGRNVGSFGVSAPPNA